MAYLQIGPRRTLPAAVPDRLLPELLSVDPWMHHANSARACSVTTVDGTVHSRVSIKVIDEFDDAWAVGFAGDGVVDVAEIAVIQPSRHALPADLATKAMYGEEWRMGAYRYAVQTFEGDKFTLVHGVAVWLPDSLTSDQIADVIPNPSEEDCLGDEIPSPMVCYLSTPQTRDSDRRAYELHFEGASSLGSELPKTALGGEARRYAERFPLGKRPLAYAAAYDRLSTGVSRYSRFMGDDIDLLASFAAREGHCLVPEGHIEAGRPLSITGLAMVASMNQLSPSDRQRLESIPGWEAAASRATRKLLTPQRAAELAAIEKEKRAARIKKARSRARKDNRS
ncbi:MAG: hypothetical protein GY722_19490 [bacterium]|nr:hypothetical protein [bacterium]